MANKQPTHDRRATATPPSVTTHGVAALAGATGLSLTPQRVAVVQPILAAWLADSAALNALMQADAHREVVPITVLRHAPHDVEGG